MKNRILLFLLSAVLFGSACKSDDDGDDINLTSGYDRIVDRNYRIIDLEVRANGNLIADGRDLLDCELDDINRYENTGTASTRYGISRCDPSEPNERFYFWTLISNDSKLILDYGTSLRVYNIILNDGTRLVLERFTIEDIDNDGADESIQTITTYTRN